MNLTALQRDPAKFRDALTIDASEGAVRFAATLDDWQAADLTALDPGWRSVVGQDCEGYLRAYLERPRGHSKTTDLAIMVSWVLFASRRQLTGVAAAADRDQAKLLRDAIARIVKLNPWLAQVLEIQAYRVVNSHTESTLDILSCDAATSYGITPDFIILDELTHWTNEDLWNSLLSAAAKRRRCMLCIISNAGVAKGQSWQWHVRENARTDANWYFSRLDGPRASWISAELLEEQARLLPSIAYARLWLNRWTSGAGDALSEADIDAAVTLDGPSHVRRKGFVYVAGLDLGLSRDASALCVLGKNVGYMERQQGPQPKRPTGTLAALQDLGYIDGPSEAEETSRFVDGTGELHLVALEIWKPSKGRKVQVSAIERTIAALDESLDLAAVGFDPFQAEYLGERLRESGTPAEAITFTGANLQAFATTALDAFRERQLRLYPHDDLLADLRALQVVERSYGFRLQSPRRNAGEGTRHGDAATALILALHVARRFANYIAPPRVDRQLVYT